MDLTDTTNRLLFAIPKKGRLYDKCINLLQGIDVQFHRKNRHDVAFSSNHPITLVFLPAKDIAKYVADGNVDLGITGQDIIYESEVQTKVSEVFKLGFGKCKLQIQAPLKDNQTIQSGMDLVGKRIVTSFPNLTRQHFNLLETNSELDANGEKKETIIEFVSGSVEVACTLGLADGIVDLVESGETMYANNLHAIGTVLLSEAVLIASSLRRSKFQGLIDLLKNRIEGAILATKYVICTYNVARTNLEQAKAITPGRKAPSVAPLENEGWVAVSAMVEKMQVAEVMDQLKQVGATDVIITTIQNCRA